MPDFHAVQCFQCSVFQVQHVKKVAKFACTLCGAKQSVRQVYAISSKASDVRGVVVSLNARRQAADEAQDSWAPEDDATEPAPPSVLWPQVDWTQYVEQEANPEIDAVSHSGRQQSYVTELPGHAARRGRGKRKAADADACGEDAAADMGQQNAGQGRQPRNPSIAAAQRPKHGLQQAGPALSSRAVTGNGSTGSRHAQAAFLQTGGHTAVPGTAAATGSAQWAGGGQKSGSFAQGHDAAERGRWPAAPAAAKAEKPASKWGDFDDDDAENEAPQQRRNVLQQARNGGWTRDAAVMCKEDDHGFATTFE